MVRFVGFFSHVPQPVSLFYPRASYKDEYCLHPLISLRVRIFPGFFSHVPQGFGHYFYSCRHRAYHYITLIQLFNIKSIITWKWNEIETNYLKWNWWIEIELFNVKWIENELFKMKLFKMKWIENEIIQNEMNWKWIIQNEIIQNEIIQNEISSISFQIIFKHLANIFLSTKWDYSMELKMYLMA